MIQFIWLKSQTEAISMHKHLIAAITQCRYMSGLDFAMHTYSYPRWTWNTSWPILLKEVYLESTATKCACQTKNMHIFLRILTHANLVLGNACIHICKANFESYNQIQNILISNCHDSSRYTLVRGQDRLNYCTV